MLTADAIFDHLLYKEGMFESQTLWCEAALVMCLACGGREGEREREREMAHPRAQHPSCHHGRKQCAAGFTNVLYISMKGDGGGGGVCVRGKGGLILLILDGEQEGRYPCA